MRRARTRAEDLHKFYLKGISVTSKLELNKNIPILNKGAQECHSSVCQGLTGVCSVFEFKFLRHRPMVCRKYSYFEIELGIDDEDPTLWTLAVRRVGCTVIILYSLPSGVPAVKYRK